MPLPDLREFCIDVDVVPGEVCITFPGGAELCATIPDLVPPQPDKLIRALFAQVNAALQPLTPIFNIIDAVVAIFECVKAISTLNPEEIINCENGAWRAIGNRVIHDTHPMGRVPIERSMARMVSREVKCAPPTNPSASPAATMRLP